MKYMKPRVFDMVVKYQHGRYVPWLIRKDINSEPYIQSNGMTIDEELFTEMERTNASR